VERVERSLFPAFSKLVPTRRLKDLLQVVSNKIPPLSREDERDLFVRIPILAACIQSASLDDLKVVLSEVDGNDNVASLDLLNGLASYTLSAEHLRSARVAAASCVHGLLRKGLRKGGDCPVKPLLTIVADILDPSADDLGTMENCLSFLSLLVSASVCPPQSNSGHHGY
jgi:hypothetical protein